MEFVNNIFEVKLGCSKIVHIPATECQKLPGTRNSLVLPIIIGSMFTITVSFGYVLHQERESNMAWAE